MKEIKPEHYVDTILYSIDIIIRNLKLDLKQKIDKLNIGITGEQFVVLDTIAYHKNMYQQKLSDILMKDKSNTTRIIKVLADKDLITRETGSINNRLVYILNVTDKGKKLIQDNIPKIKKYLSDIFINITDNEIDMLHSLSKKFQKDLHENAY